MTKRDPVLTALFLVSLAGLAASCLLHVAALLGFSPGLAHSKLWLIHGIGFLVMIAALLAAWNVVDTLQPRRFSNAIRYAPFAYRAIAWGLMGYGIIVGFGMLVSSPATAYVFGQGEIANGLFLLQRIGADSGFGVLTCGRIVHYTITSLLLASATNVPLERLSRGGHSASGTTSAVK